MPVRALALMTAPSRPIRRRPCGPQRIAHRLEIARTIIDEG